MVSDARPSVEATRKRKKLRPPAKAPKLDLRQQVVNEGLSGKVTDVSIRQEIVTKLRGIVLDLDPELLTGRLMPPDLTSGSLLSSVKIWLSRHPTLAKAEIRDSGRGLHVLLLLKDPLELKSDTERERWACIVRAIQRMLPTDPDCPGITALTRPINSTNSKTGKKVRTLVHGTPIELGDLESLYSELRSKPFATVAGVLLGPGAKCPSCGKGLWYGAQAGRCYSCGKLELIDLYGFFVGDPNEL